ncbi:MAG: hypothetical protein MUC83_13405 [Pirellula sp.]|jgi:hypothetical protein|nr:hypothetical protein [Pirellula sp.]
MRRTKKHGPQKSFVSLVATPFQTATRFRVAYALVVWACSLLLTTGCGVLKPQSIQRVRNNLPSDLTPDNEPIIERGQPRPIIDGFGWVWGIPSKIILWNRRAENHNISSETEQWLVDYMVENDLYDVKARLNQYRPFDDWRRLVRNKSVAWPWRYTFGVVATAGETIFPGRLFGGDHYNPYTATIHLYSDIPSIALHEAGHAKDFSNREYPGTYAALYTLPIVPLYHERVATNDVLAYVGERGDLSLQQESRHVLYPAYGTYAGSAAGSAISQWSAPLYVAGLLVGHAAGRYEAQQLQ